MKWFSGPIQDAIATAKHSQKIFLVFVEGKDDTSKKMMGAISEPNISNSVDENCVAIKLVTDSEPFRQFSQIYPVIIVPSIFFIGVNGIPLEVIAGSENDQDLSTKVHKAIQLHKSRLSESSAATSSTATTSSASSSTTPSVNTPLLAQASVKTTDVPTTQGEPSKSEDASSKETEEDPAEQARIFEELKAKVERAEKLVTERRILKEKERMEEEKRREIEQRKVGKEMQKARENMKDKEMADWAKQSKKEKEEDKAARERILAQIAQDKADRAAKFQYSSGASPAASQEPSPPPEVRQRSPAESTLSSSNVTRIQFRLPNNTRVTQEFSSDATLNDVIKHVEQTFQGFFGSSGFSLATTFPRRHFARCDFPRSLRDLELAPSAVLLVLPVSGSNPVASTGHGGSGFFSILWTLLSPLTTFWGFVYSRIFGAPSSGNPGSSATAPSTSQGGPAAASSSRQGPYRRDGNVHRLANESSNEDEDGTWNGNSTQQM